jgi:Asp-tRNA(Asn)/Glu-tRNA(Gln) amidotransferase A subunit family amidase
MDRTSVLDRAHANKWLAREISRQPLSDSGSLAGLRFFAKDLFAIEGEVTRSGSAIFDDDSPATCDAGLIASSRQCGARLLGTTNMDALAYGFVSNNPIYGLARNPHDHDRICGGSSGGSAAVVAAGLADFSLGTDTSGSIRVPSAFCGVAGYKPSAGVLDDHGITALSPTFDRPGLFASDLAVLNRVASAIGTLAPFPPVYPSKPFRVGMLGGYFFNGMEPAVEQAALDFAAYTGARTGIEIAGAAAARAAAYILVAHEASQVHAHNLRSRSDRFDSETRQRLMAASLISDEWRTAAIAMQAEFGHRFCALFEMFDVLVAPCVPMLAPLFSELEAENSSRPPLRASLGQYTQPISLTGCPVVSVPLTTTAGLPTAMQLIGPIGSDYGLLRFAQEIAS